MLYKINTEFKKYSTLDSVKDILDDLSTQKFEISILDLSLNTFVPEVFVEVAKVIKEMQNLKHIKLESIFDSLTFEEMTDVLRALSLALPQGSSLLRAAQQCCFMQFSRGVWKISGGVSFAGPKPA
ncbi:uncharacterized protein VICG_00625 [Vittaforma corneae ATCC 50505]|uniref:Uncharacterized protein n=1 Tax=Vittaforma corneae (strain ATCC 50505) TaxID=993615 RepID=L2GN24_VITCO|nr:uncharacterized protein VICG_00625 [Vittaforma corneae ATCC 50505]ELA42226.1 hypothetical protein VICG_00625 [Vittaforma corneae ATCC 50505]